MPRRKLFLLILVTGSMLYVLFALALRMYVHEPGYDFSVYSETLLSDEVHVRTETADELAKEVRVLCFVTTRPGYEDRAVAVNVTWLKRCTRHVFVTSSPLSRFSADEMMILANVPEGREHLTAKTFAALNHLYTHELDYYDWFVKADDDVYLIVENLRLMLSQFSPDDAVYLGHHFRVNIHNGYMSGGASYVLSRQALRIMGRDGLPQNGGICKPREPDEDVEVGRCLEAVGVQPYRTVDTYGRETFHPWSLDYTLFSNRRTKYELHSKVAGPNCCSQLTISFHYVTPQTIFTLEMLLYHVGVYGRHQDDVTLRRVLFRLETETVPHKDETEVF